jgi:hypothetical protein
MDSCQEDDRIPRLHSHKEHAAEELVEVGCARGQRFMGSGDPALYPDVLHIRASLRPQEFLGNILRRGTGCGDIDQPERRRFGRRLRSHRPGAEAAEPSRPDKREPSQEPPPAELSSVLGTHRNLLSRCWSV